MPNDKPKSDVAVGSYKVTTKDGTVVVLITSGSLKGKSARLIEMPPSAAYFNEKSKEPA